MKTKYIALGLIIGFGLSACGTHNGLIHPKSGVAIKKAADAQIVDKNAVPGAPEYHPQKAADAVDRYLKDEIKRPASAGDLAFGAGGGDTE